MSSTATSADDALARISDANQPGRSSAEVQATFGEFARELGFQNESVGLFGSDELALRPDYFLKLDSTGILLEVERGKTTINTWSCSTSGSAKQVCGAGLERASLYGTSGRVV